MVKRKVFSARAALETDEHHERRRDPAVEAEVVGPARAHGRGEVESDIGEAADIDGCGFAFGNLDSPLGDHTRRYRRSVRSTW